MSDPDISVKGDAHFWIHAQCFRSVLIEMLRFINFDYASRGTVNSQNAVNSPPLPRRHVLREPSSSEFVINVGYEFPVLFAFCNSGSHEPRRSRVDAAAQDALDN